jgi:hypothetical protein
MRAYATEVEQAWGVNGFAVRVGVGTGPVVLGALGAGSRVEYAAFGDTVNVAARLQSAAPPGRVLVDEATAYAVEGAFETEEPVALELKGKSLPLHARAVVRARGRRRAAAAADAALVGRLRWLVLQPQQSALDLVEWLRSEGFRTLKRQEASQAGRSYTVLVVAPPLP